jgi:putative FmdB family regulatory protein
MPVYEFRCTECSKTFDEKETFAEHDKHPEVKCPHCGSTAVEPLMSAVLVKTSKKS